MGNYPFDEAHTIALRRLRQLYPETRLSRHKKTLRKKELKPHRSCSVAMKIGDKWELAHWANDFTFDIVREPEDVPVVVMICPVGTLAHEIIAKDAFEAAAQGADDFDAWWRRYVDPNALPDDASRLYAEVGAFMSDKIKK